MTTDEIPPRIDQWYLDSGNDRSFTVTDFDQEEGYVEIRYFDDEQETLDMEEWNAMFLEEIEQPEDLIRELDDLELKNLGYDDL